MNAKKELSWPQLFKRALTRPFDYQSKSSRAEFWVFTITQVVILTALNTVNFTITQIQNILVSSLTIYEIENGFGPAIAITSLLGTLLNIIYLIGIIYFGITSIALINRRLRDLAMNTWLTPVFLIPCVSLILALILFTRQSPDPKTT